VGKRMKRGEIFAIKVAIFCHFCHATYALAKPSDLQLCKDDILCTEYCLSGTPIP
jgi:hypothetical protein